MNAVSCNGWQSEDTFFSKIVKIQNARETLENFSRDYIFWKILKMKTFSLQRAPKTRRVISPRHFIKLGTLGLDDETLGSLEFLSFSPNTRRSIKWRGKNRTTSFKGSLQTLEPSLCNNFLILAVWFLTIVSWKLCTLGWNVGISSIPFAVQ